MFHSKCIKRSFMEGCAEKRALNRVISVQWSTYLYFYNNSIFENLWKIFYFREVLWHAGMELLAFILPLINTYKIKNFIQKLSKSDGTKQENIDQSKCSYCKNDMICAVQSNCSHLFCYFCLSANLKAVSQFSCPICSQNLTDINMLQDKIVNEYK